MAEKEQLPDIRIEGGLIRPTSFQEAMSFALAIVRSGFAPKDSTPESVLCAMQFGAEVGMKPLQSIQNIAVINGRPSIFGDAALALCKTHPKWKGCKETEGGEGDGRWAHIVVKREDEPDVEKRFDVADAKEAGLWSKAGPWTHYKKRMLQMRARGFALRDQYPDVLKGLILAEEAMDYPEPRGPQKLEYAKFADENEQARNGALKAEMDAAGASERVPDTDPDPEPSPAAPTPDTPEPTSKATTAPDLPGLFADSTKDNRDVLMGDALILMGRIEQAGGDPKQITGGRQLADMPMAQLSGMVDDLRARVEALA